MAAKIQSALAVARTLDKMPAASLSRCKKSACIRLCLSQTVDSFKESDKAAFALEIDLLLKVKRLTLLSLRVDPIF